ncbi:hypothetical protein KFE98_21205 [bacterium SCSIO 12741]|nr:hypothetical protein KFE98_21205 [bacterium SCSIO 12741]
MNFLLNITKDLSDIAKAFLIIGLLLLIYGLVSRWLPIYFLWESLPISGMVLLLAVLSILAKKMSGAKRQGKNTTGYKLGLGFLGFVFFAQTLMFFIIPNTKAYDAACWYFTQLPEIQNEIGPVVGFGMISSGSISIEQNDQGETGAAQINLIIKGERKFKSVTVYVYKDYGNNWEVYEWE